MVGVPFAVQLAIMVPRHFRLWKPHRLPLHLVGSCRAVLCTTAKRWEVCCHEAHWAVNCKAEELTRTALRQEGSSHAKPFMAKHAAGTICCM